MKKVQTIIFCLAIALVLGIFQQALTADSKGEKDVMHFQETIIALAGATETKADYFASESARSVVFAPGAMFRKESWHFLAEKFQELGISSVALNSGSTPDLLNAVAFLRAKGIEKITIVGASAGGAGVLATLNGNIDPLVDSVILLAPAGGPPIKSRQVKKLFIVAENDMISSNAKVYKLYINSSDPKLYKEITGSSKHAQHLFNSKHKEDVIQLMIDFIDN